MSVQRDSRQLAERRSGKERRVSHHCLLRQLLGRGQRTRVRRSADRRRLNLLDRYDTSVFALLMLILALSLIDAFLTLVLLQRGAVEINPIMAHYIGMGPQIFVIVKYTLTVLALILLLFLRDWFSQRFRSGHLLLPATAAIVGSVVLWELHLLARLAT